MRHFHFSCQGESHKATDKPCQDSSLSYSEDGLSIAIVCDGHGGERYFRSDVGSRFCVEVTKEAIVHFVKNVDKSLFVGMPFTQKRSISESLSSDKLSDTDIALRHLFASIINAWNHEIEQHAQSNPPSEIELSKVKPQYIEALTNKSSLEKIYGCTLMAYVCTADYWFAFHLGDGKCISFHIENPDIWKEPIPWDEKCFLNKTTSICDSEALDEFRFCYQGDGKFPAAIFLGSDGMDDSFGPIENLVDFYMQVVKLLAKGNDDVAKRSIEETLPVLSKKGSQDDMSVAYVYDLKSLQELVPKILRFQIDVLKQRETIEKLKIEELQNRLESFVESTTQKDIIERDYALKDIERHSVLLENIKRKLNERVAELRLVCPTSTKQGRCIDKKHFLKVKRKLMRKAQKKYGKK